jgi:hypothetical protein
MLLYIYTYINSLFLTPPVRSTRPVRVLALVQLQQPVDARAHSASDSKVGGTFWTRPARIWVADAQSLAYQLCVLRALGWSGAGAGLRLIIKFWFLGFLMWLEFVGKAGGPREADGGPWGFPGVLRDPSGWGRKSEKLIFIAEPT